jgi:hypothetical protein
MCLPQANWATQRNSRESRNSGGRSSSSTKRMRLVASRRKPSPPDCSPRAVFQDAYTTSIQPGANQGNRLNPRLLRTTRETCAVHSPRRILTRRKQEGPRRTMEQNAHCAPRESLSTLILLRRLPASAVLKTLRASHLRGRRDARRRVSLINRSDRTPTRFKRLSCGQTQNSGLPNG